MADIPTPRSYEQIVSDIVDAFIARTGISALKVGSPILSMIEAVAQSQLRNSEDVFNLLQSNDLNQATGDALTQIAADEGLERKNASASFGYVTITNNGYGKVSSPLSVQAAAGQNVITVVDASLFEIGGSVRIGSETPSITNKSTNTLTLSSNLSSVYVINTEVVFIPSTSTALTVQAGTSVSTGTINFNIVNTVTIPAGESSVANVAVVCSTVGTAGNIPASTIRTFNSTIPFQGTVTNPLAFVNGQDQETDELLRDRIRTAKRDKQRGTVRSIENAVIGAVASDESKIVTSSNIVDTGLGKATLYIDDGTGYEATTSAVGIETLTSFATGGEKYFQIQGGRPISKAFLTSGEASPYDISNGFSFTVKVNGGTAETVSWSTGGGFFADPTKATAYEMVSYINSQLKSFRAFTTDGATKFILSPAEDTGHTIVVTADDAFNFPINLPTSTLYLFKNGVLLEEGVGADYTLDRNRGMIYLDQELTSGDSLVVGSVDVRAGIETNALTNPQSYTDQYVWLLADDTKKINYVGFDAGDSIGTSYNSGTDTLTLTATGKFADVVIGDWLIVWDSGFDGNFWTKRIQAATEDSIEVECETDPSLDPTITLDSANSVGVFRTDNVPQKINVNGSLTPSQTVDFINSQSISGIYAKLISTNKIGFYTNSYQSGGSVQFLTGTSSIVSLWGLDSETDYKANPTDYQASLVGNSEMATPIFDLKSASASSDDTGRISEFMSGEQTGFRTTQEDPSTYRQTLNGGVVSTDLKLVSQGYHIGANDTVSIELDNDTTKTYNITIPIDAKIDGTSITDPNGNPLSFTGSLNDWAIWTANASALPDTNELTAITFKTKFYGPTQPIAKVEYKYPLAKETDVDYSINYGTFSVILPSGSENVPTSVDPTQRYYVSARDSGTLTREIVYKFTGEIVHVAAPYKLIRFLASSYPGIETLTGFINDSHYAYVIGLGNFHVIGTYYDGGTGLFSIYLDDPSGLIVATETRSFNISSNETINQSADLSNLPSDSLINSTLTNESYRITAADGTKITIRDDVNDPDYWIQPDLSFFNLSSAAITSIDNPYLDVVDGIAVYRSTEDTLDFDSVAIAADGNMAPSDQIDWVKTTSPFVTKEGTAYSDELVKLVPVTAQNIADNINSQLSSVGTSVSVSGAGEIELVRNEAGADSSVTVTSGIANQLSATVIESSGNQYAIDLDNTYSFVKGNMAKVQKEANYSRLTGSTNVTVSGNELSTNSEKLWELWENAYTPDPKYIPECVKWTISKVGNFAMFKSDTAISQLADVMKVGQWVQIRRPEFVIPIGGVSGSTVTITGFSKAHHSIQAGDTLLVNNTVKEVQSVSGTGITFTNSTGLAALAKIRTNTLFNPNYGLFRVTAVDSANNVFWVENPYAVEETASFATIFFSPNSILTGSSFRVFTVLNGTKFSSTVSSLPTSFDSLANDYASTTRSVNLPSSYSTVTYNAQQISFTRSDLDYAVCEILSFSAKDSSSVWLNAFLTTPEASFIGTSSSTNPITITALNKLGFATNQEATNSDGYQYYTGLIGESNRIVYGDAADPVNYGGYAAANANIEILAPQVKQISMKIYVRMASGFTLSDAIASVRSAAQTAVNSTPVGQDVAYSDVIAAINALTGVYSVAIEGNTVETPTIPVQAFEKPMVINLEKDIQVTITGI